MFVCFAFLSLSLLPLSPILFSPPFLKNGNYKNLTATVQWWCDSTIRCHRLLETRPNCSF
jgi:hypothetical protein